MRLTRFKKTIALCGTALMVSLFSIPTVRAQMGDMATMLLASINRNTQSINTMIWGLSGYIVDIDQSVTSAAPYSKNNLWGNTYATLVALNSWLITDSSKPTSNLQSALTNMTIALTPDPTNLMPLQQQLTNDFFSSQKITTTNLINANDLAYETVLKQPYFSPDPRDNPATGEKVNSAYNFLKNVSGLTITHALPNNSWRGSTMDVLKYQSYYNTISAIQTYNAYVLSQIYTNVTNDTTFTKAQADLIAAASGSGWFSTVASENIGFVLRQILMFTSQTYVLLSQLVNAQNQMVQTQAMTNSLLILLNQSTEQTLALQASGTMPKVP